MDDSKKKIGELGEEEARKFLEKNNYKILDRNFRTRFGEIDIVALDKETDEIVFVEVKTRASADFGLPEEFVNYKKQQKIKRAAFTYLAENKTYKNWRIDVVSVILDESGVKDIRIIKNITQ